MRPRLFQETKDNYKKLKQLRKESLENEHNEAIFSNYKQLLIDTIHGDGMYAAMATNIMFQGMKGAWEKQYKDHPFGIYHPDAIPHQEKYIELAKVKN